MKIYGLSNRGSTELITKKLAISYDASSNGGYVTGANASMSYSHTTGTGTNRVLVVAVSTITSGMNTGDFIATVKYNGVSLTRAIVGTSFGTLYYTLRSSLWYLLSPPSGVNTIAITSTLPDGTGYIVSLATSYAGVKQSSQPDATGHLEESDSVPPFTLDIPITTVDDNCWLVGSHWTQGGRLPPEYRVKNTTLGYFNLADSDAAMTPAGAKTFIFTNSSDIKVGVVLSLSPAAAPASATSPAFLMNMI